MAEKHKLAQFQQELGQAKAQQDQVEVYYFKHILTTFSCAFYLVNVHLMSMLTYMVRLVICSHVMLSCSLQYKKSNVREMSETVVREQ